MTKYPETGGGWIKRPAPVMGDETLGTCFDVHVLHDADGFHMHFSWRPKDSLAVAHSMDGISRNGISNWERLPANPIVSPTPGGWDEAACYKPGVLWDEQNHRWMLWYNGRKGSAEYIGLATHAGRDLGFGTP